MGKIYVREGNSEIIIFLDKHYSTDTHALQEASKILQREVVYRESHPNNYLPGQSSSH